MSEAVIFDGQGVYGRRSHVTKDTEHPYFRNVMYPDSYSDPSGQRDDEAFGYLCRQTVDQYASGLGSGCSVTKDFLEYVGPTLNSKRYARYGDLYYYPEVGGSVNLGTTDFIVRPPIAEATLEQMLERIVVNKMFKSFEGPYLYQTDYFVDYHLATGFVFDLTSGWSL